MTSHRAILSIYDVFRNANSKTQDGIPQLPGVISHLNTKKEIGANSTVTLDDVEDANDVALAIRGHYASKDPEIKRKVELITEMYTLAIKNAYSNATFFCDCAPPVDYHIKIGGLEDKIEELKSDIASSCASSLAELEVKITAAQIATRHAQTSAHDAESTANDAQTTSKNAQATANKAQATATTAQATANAAKDVAHNAQTTANAAKTTANTARINAKNVLIADQNSHRRYTKEFSTLKKVVIGPYAGFDHGNDAYGDCRIAT
ncbi:hypothetical protein IW261DRAFT_1421018 [Armillaria novae-zelandiae]|uniref:Uncharacterized protein n=1 Tax=Armillaria novae-zelandiae TaxID=153914 RepID=A0AA39P4T1_9AGAR|nr:hypothetical protein IW261DRAFT_1421018 [Armillaria novae-zelandiae]